jgi:anaerobic selenocysteine-containing dehydrogenase
VKFKPTPPRRRIEGYNPPLQVSRFISTRAGDVERGPRVWLNAGEAALRLLQDGEMVWIFGPRRHDLAELSVDDSVPRGFVVARDVAGIAAAEVVHVVKPDLDTRDKPVRA